LSTDISSLSDIKGAIIAGVAAGDHVMISSVTSISDNTPWSTVFSSYLESDALADPKAFTEYVVEKPGTFASVLGSDAPSNVSLYSFSNSFHVGSAAVSIPVPLPSQCLIGGALFALLALSKRSVKWLRLRQEQSLA
jgi:hypothetical protein